MIFVGLVSLSLIIEAAVTFPILGGRDGACNPNLNQLSSKLKEESMASPSTWLLSFPGSVYAKPRLLSCSSALPLAYHPLQNPNNNKVKQSIKKTSNHVSLSKSVPTFCLFLLSCVGKGRWSD